MSFFLIQKAGYLLGNEIWETWDYYNWWFTTNCRNSSIRDCEYLNKHDPVRIDYPSGLEGKALEIQCGKYILAPLMKLNSSFFIILY